MRSLSSHSLCIFFTLAFFCVTAQSQIQLRGNRISARPKIQEKILGENIEVLKTEHCAAEVPGSQSIDLPTGCDYLHGLYRYIYLPKGETRKRQVLADFAVTRTNRGTFSFLVNEPIEIEE